MYAGSAKLPPRMKRAFPVELCVHSRTFPATSNAPYWLMPSNCPTGAGPDALTLLAGTMELPEFAVAPDIQ